MLSPDQPASNPQPGQLGSTQPAHGTHAPAAGHAGNANAQLDKLPAEPQAASRATVADSDPADDFFDTLGAQAEPTQSANARESPSVPAHAPATAATPPAARPVDTSELGWLGHDAAEPARGWLDPEPSPVNRPVPPSSAGAIGAGPEPIHTGRTAADFSVPSAASGSWLQPTPTPDPLVSSIETPAEQSASFAPEAQAASVTGVSAVPTYAADAPPSTDRLAKAPALYDRRPSSTASWAQELPQDEHDGYQGGETGPMRQDLRTGVGASAQSEHAALPAQPQIQPDVQSEELSGSSAAAASDNFLRAPGRSSEAGAETAEPASAPPATPPPPRSHAASAEPPATLASPPRRSVPASGVVPSGAPLTSRYVSSWDPPLSKAAADMATRPGGTSPPSLGRYTVGLSGPSPVRPLAGTAALRASEQHPRHRRERQQMLRTMPPRLPFSALLPPSPRAQPRRRKVQTTRMTMGHRSACAS